MQQLYIDNSTYVTIIHLIKASFCSVYIAFSVFNIKYTTVDMNDRSCAI